MPANQALLNEFVSEAREHLATVGDDLLALEKAAGDEARECLDRLFRAMHSVKGGASLVACRQIAALAHLLETVLDRLRQGKLAAGPTVMDNLLAGSDLVHTLLDDVGNSDQVDITAALARLEGLLAAPPAAAARVPALSGRPLLNERSSKYPLLYTLRVDLVTHGRRTGRSPAGLLADLQESGCILDARIHVPDHDLTRGLPEGPVDYECLYASVFAVDQLAPRLRLTTGEVFPVGEGIETTRQGDKETRRQGDREISGDKKGAPPRSPVGARAQAAVGPEAESERPSTVRIGVQVLDRLMTLAGELVLVRNQALQAVDPDDARMRPVVQQLNVLTTDVQQAVMMTRMQPVSILFNKFPRLVRDLARQLGKQIELSLRGTEVELDKTILEALSDPLTHLVRNACDHGIEPSAERVAAGKRPEGHIVLHARHEGGQIRIELRDDGRGIDPARVRRTALAKGLKTAVELAGLSDAEAQALILTPGFSTAEQVTEVSGRGVGMDVVKTNVEQLRGRLQIESTPGAGTCVHLRLPLTLAIIPCLIVSTGGECYAIPQKDLEELVCLAGGEAAGKVEYAFDQPFYRLRDRLLPLVWLSEVLSRPAPFASAARPGAVHPGRPPDPRPLLSFAVVKAGGQRFGLVVDQLLDTEEIVVKPMHPILRSLRCFAGATIRGDGRVALILDIEGIAHHTALPTPTAAPTESNAEEAVEQQEILLFRYGTDEQFAVPLAMVRRIEEVHTSDFDHIGGREYVTVKGRSVRVLRLDRYLEVSPPSGKGPVYLLLPKHTRQPVGIVLNEIVDTPRLAVELDSHSYRADGVLGTALVGQRMTLFLDLYRLGDRAMAEDEALAPPSRPSGPARGRILVVDDTQFFRQLVKGYLEKEGYEVVTAENGVLGVHELESQPFDLVVSDIEMPELDGWQLARTVRDRLGRRDLPLLALTTLNSDADRQRACECGFDGYEVKVDRESFLASVAKLIKRPVEAAGAGGPAHG
jgi:two-component system chemotaxis sensor kinase CheA